MLAARPSGPRTLPGRPLPARSHHARPTSPAALEEWARALSVGREYVGEVSRAGSPELESPDDIPTPGPADRASDDETPDPEPYAPVTRVIVRVVHQDASTTVYQVCAPPERRLHVGTHVALYRPDGAAIGIARRVSAVHAPERHNVTVNLVLQRAAADEPELLLNVSLARGWVGRLPAWVREVWESPARETLPATYAEPQVWKGSRPWWSPVAPARGKPGTDRMNDDVYTDIERAYRTFQILHPGF